MSQRGRARSGAAGNLGPECPVRHGLKPRFWAAAVNCHGRYGAGLLAACGLLLIPQLGGPAANHLLR